MDEELQLDPVASTTLVPLIQISPSVPPGAGRVPFKIIPPVLASPIIKGFLSVVAIAGAEPNKVRLPDIVALPPEEMANFVLAALSNLRKLPVNVPPPPPVLSKSMNNPFPENAEFPPWPSFNIFPDVMALAVASKILPVVIVLEVIFTRFPDAVGLPKT